MPAGLLRPPACLPACLSAALGTSLELKSQFGVGYTLTLSRSAAGGGEAGGAEAGVGAAADSGGDSAPETAAEAAAAAEQLTALVRQHVPEAQLLSAPGEFLKGFKGGGFPPLLLRGSLGMPPAARQILHSGAKEPSCPDCAGGGGGSEAAFGLPKECAAAFPPLLRALQQRGGELGVDSYGLSVTTLEEVFLRVSESAAAASAASAAAAVAAAAAAAAAAVAAPGPVGPATATLGEQRGQHKEAEVANGSADGTADGTAAAEVDRSEFVLVNLPRRCYLKVTPGGCSAGTAAPAGSWRCSNPPLALLA